MKKRPTTLDELRKWLELNRRSGGRKRPRARAVGVKSRSVQREASRADVRVEAPAGFVEFSGAQLLEATVGGVVELSDAEGVRLTIKLGGAQALDVAAVVAAFRGAQR